MAHVKEMESKRERGERGRERGERRGGRGCGTECLSQFSCYSSI